jgi:hypothetical protein
MTQGELDLRRDALYQVSWVRVPWSRDNGSIMLHRSSITAAAGFQPPSIITSLLYILLLKAVFFSKALFNEIPL